MESPVLARLIPVPGRPPLTPNRYRLVPSSCEPEPPLSTANTPPTPRPMPESMCVGGVTPTRTGRAGSAMSHHVIPALAGSRPARRPARAARPRGRPARRRPAERRAAANRPADVRCRLAAPGNPAWPARHGGHRAARAQAQRELGDRGAKGAIRHCRGLPAHVPAKLVLRVQPGSQIRDVRVGGELHDERHNRPPGSSATIVDRQARSGVLSDPLSSAVFGAAGGEAAGGYRAPAFGGHAEQGFALLEHGLAVFGPVGVLDVPDAVEPLVDYYRAISGEHPRCRR